MAEGEAVGGCLAIVAGLFAIYVILMIIYWIITNILLPTLGMVAGTGTLIGAGTAIRNYVIAFKRNVRPVRIEEVA